MRHTNVFGDEGGIALAKALQTNSTLRSMKIGVDNSFGIETRKAFVRVFRSSVFPVSYVTGLRFDSDEEKSMLESRKVNESRLVQGVISGDIPDALFPHVVGHLSEKKQHVNKLFTILCERPDNWTVNCL